MGYHKIRPYLLIKFIKKKRFVKSIKPVTEENEDKSEETASKPQLFNIFLTQISEIISVSQIIKYKKWLNIKKLLRHEI